MRCQRHRITDPTGTEQRFELGQSFRPARRLRQLSAIPFALRRRGKGRLRIQFHRTHRIIELQRVQPDLQRREHAFHRVLRLRQADAPRHAAAMFQYQSQLQRGHRQMPRCQTAAERVKHPLELENQEIQILDHIFQIHSLRQRFRRPMQPQQAAGLCMQDVMPAPRLRSQAVGEGLPWQFHELSQTLQSPQI